MKASEDTIVIEPKGEKIEKENKSQEWQILEKQDISDIYYTVLMYSFLSNN